MAAQPASALAALLAGGAGAAGAAGAGAALAGLPAAAAGAPGSPTRRAFDYATYLAGLIDSGIDVGLPRDRRAVTGTPLDAQRAALYQNMADNRNGQIILEALERCGRTGSAADCAATPELAQAFAAFRAQVPNPTVFTYSPQQQRQRTSREDNLNARYPRNQAATDAKTLEACRTAGGVVVRRADGTFLRCRSRGSSAGRGARSPVNRGYKQLVRFGAPDTPQACVAVGGTPILYAGYRPGSPIRCRGGRVGGLGSPQGGAGGLQAIVGPARLAGIASYDDADFYDGADMYDQSGGMRGGTASRGNRQQYGGFGQQYGADQYEDDGSDFRAQLYEPEF